MITPVSFPIAKLLTHTEFNQKSTERGYIIATGEESFDYAIDYMNRKAIAAPTIAELVMWLYEKHGIWIVPLPTPTKHFVFGIYNIEKPYELVNGEMKKSFNSPTEAYEAAIEHTLKNLINERIQI